MQPLFHSLVFLQKTNFNNFRIIIGGLIQQILINHTSYKLVYADFTDY